MIHRDEHDETRTKGRTRGEEPSETTPLFSGISVDECDVAPLSCNKSRETIADDVVDILRLGVPIAISYLSWIGKKTTDSALLGHVSQKALAAASLSDLWTMTTQVLLSGRVLRVLVGGAVGSGTRTRGSSFGIHGKKSNSVPHAICVSSVYRRAVRQPKTCWHLPAGIVRCTFRCEHFCIFGMEPYRKSMDVVWQRSRYIQNGWLLCSGFEFRHSWHDWIQPGTCSWLVEWKTYTSIALPAASFAANRCSFARCWIVFSLLNSFSHKELCTR
mmetsp:Transcript_14773/g.27674  ORF Transcript_14773/g.27674 Transcript_14773/m.27674 type:complete len:273 (+) Transcript_14773:199-1017(+)